MIGEGVVCTVFETALCDKRELAKNMMSMDKAGYVLYLEQHCVIKGS